MPIRCAIYRVAHQSRIEQVTECLRPEQVALDAEEGKKTDLYCEITWSLKVMKQNDVVKEMLATIAELYETEANPQGPYTAKALLVAPFLAPFELAAPCALDSDIRTILAASSHPVARSVLAAQHLLNWGSNPVESNTQAEIAALISVLTLMGPDGPIIAPDLRLGLIYMKPYSYYPLHLHDADETYAIVSGQALWTAGNETKMRGVGSMVHHPSLMPHAFRTGAEGFLAVWRWSGDINTHSYAFTETLETALNPEAHPAEISAIG
jgi:mannose-6-phosphate isomerase-like protein (cupin superfamily)